MYRKNLWGSKESKSGVGSELANTSNVRKIISNLITELNVKTICDAPCGDFNWIRTAIPEQVSYSGTDIVPKMISLLNKAHGKPNRRFAHLDLANPNLELPQVDLIVCRDLLVHLSFQDGLNVLKNFKKSK